MSGSSTSNVRSPRCSPSASASSAFPRTPRTTGSTWLGLHDGCRSFSRRSAPGRSTRPGCVCLRPISAPRTSATYWRRRQGSRSARSRCWSRVFRRNRLFRRWCASFRAAPLRRRTYQHSRSALQNSCVRPTLRLLLHSHQHRDARSAGPRSSRKGRQTPNQATDESWSRHIPDAIKREVFERDGGRCTFADAHGRRCPETGALEFDHLDGFARTRLHRADRIRLLCRAHNQHAAEQMYGRAFMERARASTDRVPTPAEIPSG